MGRGQSGSDRIVRAQHLRPVDAGQVLVERVDHGVEAAVVVEVVGLDVREDGPGQRQLEVGAVALVGLHDEPAPPGPMGARAHVVDVAAHEVAGLPAGLGQDHRQHRRGGRLAVGAGDRHRVGLGADGGQHAGSCQHRDPGPTGRFQLEVRRRDGGGGRDRVHAGHVRRVVADVHGDSGGPQPVEHRQLTEVAPRHVVPHLGQRERDGAHARAADADDVVAARPRQVERWPAGAHSPATSSTSRTSASLRCTSPSALAAEAMPDSAARIGLDAIDLAPQAGHGQVGLGDEERGAGLGERTARWRSGDPPRRPARGRGSRAHRSP